MFLDIDLTNAQRKILYVLGAPNLIPLNTCNQGSERGSTAHSECVVTAIIYSMLEVKLQEPPHPLSDLLDTSC